MHNNDKENLINMLNFMLRNGSHLYSDLKKVRSNSIQGYVPIPLKIAKVAYQKDLVCV